MHRTRDLRLSPARIVHRVRLGFYELHWAIFFQLLEELSATDRAYRNVERSAELGGPLARAVVGTVELERERRVRRVDLQRRTFREPLHLLVHAEKVLSGVRNADVRSGLRISSLPNPDSGGDGVELAFCAAVGRGHVL